MRLGQDGGIACLDDRGAAIFQRAEDSGDSAVGVDGYTLAIHRLERGNKFLRCAQPHRVAQMRLHRLVHFFRCDKQVRCAVGMREHKAQRDWRVRHVRRRAH